MPVTAYHLVPTDATLIDREWAHKRLGVWRARKILSDNGFDPDGNPDFTIGVADTGIEWVAGVFGSVPEIDYVFSNRLVGPVAFTVGGDGRVTLPYPPNPGQAITVTMDGGHGSRSYTASATPDASHFTVVRADFTFTEPTASNTTHDYSNQLQFNVADAGLTGHVTYYDQRIVGAALNTADWNGNSASDLYDSGYDLLAPTEEVHATGVLGIIAAKNGYFHGIAPNCRLLFAALISDPNDPSGVVLDFWNTPAAFRWMKAHGAKIISSSSTPGSPIAKALALDANGQPMNAIMALIDSAQYIRDQGGLLFVAAANDNYYWDDSTPWDPQRNAVPSTCANLPGCVPVGAIFPNDNRWSVTPVGVSGDTGSNFGPKVLLASPGINMAGPFVNGGHSYGWFGHTSGATPAAAAAAALAWGVNPALTNDEFEAIMLAVRDPSYGDGRRYDGTVVPFSSEFPNAGIPSAPKMVLAVMATLPQFAGRVFPHVAFFKLPTYSGGGTEIAWKTQAATATAPPPVDVGDGPWNLTTASPALDGTATMTLSGRVAVELTGFSSDPVTRVVLKLGSTVIYDGAPTTLVMNALASGTAQALTVGAYTAGGGYAEETYSDVAVSSLALPVPADLAGAIAGASTPAASLTSRIRLAGALAGAGNTSAAASTTIGFVGTIAATSAPHAALTTGILLAGAVQGAAVPAGGMVLSAPWLVRNARAALSWLAGPFALIDRGGSIAGQVAAGSALGAALSTGIRLAGASAAASSVSGTIQTALRLAGSVTAASSVASADLTTRPAEGIFAATAAGASAVTAALTTEILVAGTAEAAGRVYGTLFDAMATPVARRLKAKIVRVGIEAKDVSVGIEADVHRINFLRSAA